MLISNDLEVHKTHVAFKWHSCGFQMTLMWPPNDTHVVNITNDISVVNIITSGVSTSLHECHEPSIVCDKETS